MDPIDIRAATEDDVPLILSLIKELAAYERLSDQVKATEVVLRESLFGSRPTAEVIIGYHQGVAAGYALFFHSFSTFLGTPGIYIEDIFVREAFRRKGIGRHLFEHVAGLAVSRNCGRLEFSVLDWNEPALKFYKEFGAEPVSGWTLYRLTGDALQATGNRRLTLGSGLT